MHRGSLSLRSPLAAGPKRRCLLREMLRVMTAIVADASRVGKTFHNNRLLISEVPIVSAARATHIESSNLGSGRGCEYRGKETRFVSHFSATGYIGT